MMIYIYIYIYYIIELSSVVFEARNKSNFGSLELFIHLHLKKKMLKASSNDYNETVHRIFMTPVYLVQAHFWFISL